VGGRKRRPYFPASRPYHSRKREKRIGQQGKGRREGEGYPSFSEVDLDEGKRRRITSRKGREEEKRRISLLDG